MLKDHLIQRKILTPQFNSYDNLKNEWKPFIMYFHQNNFTSDHVNTDEFGFRLTQINEKKYGFYFLESSSFKNA
jgi:hypothetical protein